MDKPKFLYFPDSIEFFLSKEQRSGAQKLTNHNGHWHDDSRFSRLLDNDLPLRCRHCLFLTCSYRDSLIFPLSVTSETSAKDWKNSGLLSFRNFILYSIEIGWPTLFSSLVSHGNYTATCSVTIKNTG